MTGNCSVWLPSRAKINEALFGQVDEKVKSLPLFGISKKIYKGEVFPPESDDFVSDDNLFNYQAKVIKEVAKRRILCYYRTMCRLYLKR